MPLPLEQLKVSQVNPLEGELSRYIIHQREEPASMNERAPQGFRDITFQSVVHSSFLIKVGDLTILTDPGEIFDPWVKDKFGIEQRYGEAMASAARNVDVIFCSHADFDHINLLPIAASNNPNTVILTTAISEPDIRKILTKHNLSNKVRVLQDGEIVEMKGITLKGIGGERGRHKVLRSGHAPKDNMALVLDERTIFMGDALVKGEEDYFAAMVPYAGKMLSWDEALQHTKRMRPYFVIPTHLDGDRNPGLIYAESQQELADNVEGYITTFIPLRPGQSATVRYPLG